MALKKVFGDHGPGDLQCRKLGRWSFPYATTELTCNSIFFGTIRLESGHWIVVTSGHVHSVFSGRRGSVNINRVIRDLYEEKKRLDQVIASLEEMQRNASAKQDQTPRKKRGRKSMDDQARQEVSERMKKYWATRRAGRD